MSAQQTPFRTVSGNTGSPLFPPFAAELTAGGPALASHAPGGRLVENTGAARRPVEALIRQRFDEAYGARISGFMPRLFSLEEIGGLPLGACGLRDAGSTPLFLERYLDLPIEAAIAAQLGRPVARETIVEVGQFAGQGAGAFRSLIRHLAERLHRDGQHWVVFTGTTALRNAFARLGLPVRELGIADPARLTPEEREDWGSYYRHAPRVMFGDIRAGFAALAEGGA